MNCKICNKGANLLFDRQFKLNYYHCTNCDLIFIDPAHIVSKEEELKIYEFHQNSLENEGYVTMLKEFIAKAITPYRPNSILDFGSGPEPVLSYLLKEDGYEVDIYDLYYAPEMFYYDRSYDLITITEVIEHLQDPVQTLKHLYKRLNQNGVMAITTLFHPKDNTVFQNWWYRRDKTHISFFTHDTMNILAKMLGMKVLKLGPKNLCILQK